MSRRGREELSLPPKEMTSERDSKLTWCGWRRDLAEGRSLVISWMAWSKWA